MATYPLTQIIKNIKTNQLEKNKPLFKNIIETIDFTAEKSLNDMFKHTAYPTKYVSFLEYIHSLSLEEQVSFFLHLSQEIEDREQLFAFAKVLTKQGATLFEQETPLLTYLWNERLIAPPFNGQTLRLAIDDRNLLTKNKQYVCKLIDSLQSVSINEYTLDKLKEIITHFNDEQLTYYFKASLNNLFFTEKRTNYKLINYLLESDLPFIDKQTALSYHLRSPYNKTKEVVAIKDFLSADELCDSLLPTVKLTDNEKKALLSYSLHYSQVFQFVKKKSNKEYYCTETEEDFTFKLILINNNIFDLPLKNKLILILFKQYPYIADIKLIQPSLLEFIKTPELNTELINFAFSSNGMGKLIIDFLIEQKVNFTPPENAVDSKIEYYFNNNTIKEKLTDPYFIEQHNIFHLFNSLDFYPEAEEQKQSLKHLLMFILPKLIDKIKEYPLNSLSELQQKLIKDNIIKQEQLDNFNKELTPLENKSFLNVENYLEKTLDNLSDYVFNNPVVLAELSEKDFFINFSKDMINTIFYNYSEKKGFVKNQFLITLLNSQWTEPHYHFLEKIDLDMKTKMFFTHHAFFDKSISLSPDDYYSYKTDKEQSNHYLALSKKNKDVLLCDEMIDIIKQVKQGMVSLDQALAQIEKKKETLLGVKQCL